MAVRRVHLSTIDPYLKDGLKSGRLGDKLAPGAGGFWRKTWGELYRKIDLVTLRKRYLCKVVFYIRKSLSILSSEARSRALSTVLRSDVSLQPTSGLGYCSSSKSRRSFLKTTAHHAVDDIYDQTTLGPKRGPKLHPIIMVLEAL